MYFYLVSLFSSYGVWGARGELAECRVHPSRDKVHTFRCLSKKKNPNSQYIILEEPATLCVCPQQGWVFRTDPAECCVCVVPTKHPPLHLCALQIPSCIIPVHFLSVGQLGREMWCGSPTTKKASSGIPSVSVIKVCCIPALQSFQGKAEEKVCNFCQSSNIEKGKKSPLKHHTTYTVQANSWAPISVPCHCSWTISRLGCLRDSELLLWSDYHHLESLFP